MSTAEIFNRLSSRLLALVLFSVCITSAHAETYVERFDGTFPAWQSGWFGTHSDARNVYCYDAFLSCGSRGSAFDGLGLAGTAAPYSGVPIRVNFTADFGASLTSFSLDIGAYVATTLTAYDRNGALVFSKDVELTRRGFGYDPSVYVNYTITSTNGISAFAFSNNAAGNTVIDNLNAVTTPVPEPSVWAMLAAGLTGLAIRAMRRPAINTVPSRLV